MESIPPILADILKILSGALTVLIPYTITTYRNRKKSRLENVESVARIEKTLAEARSLRVHDEIATGEGVGKFLSTMIEAGDQMRELQRRIIQAEADSAAAQLFVNQLNAAARLIICEHHPNGVRLSDFMPEQLNPPKPKQ